MEEFLREDIFDIFNEGLLSVTKGDLVHQPIFEVKLTRNDDLDLVLELKSNGIPTRRHRELPAGTIHKATEKIEFRQEIGGWTAIARGVVAQGHSWSAGSRGEGETIERFTARSVELDFNQQEIPAYTVEWVQNLSDAFVWGDQSSADAVTVFTRTVGKDAAQIKISAKSRESAGSLALQIKIANMDIYLLHPVEKAERANGSGFIIYPGCPDQKFRDRVRACLSFGLGQMIVYLGHTDYSLNWKPTFMKSVDAVSLGGAVFKVVDMPPYPICAANSRFGDKAALERIVNSLFEKFDAIKFNELSWSYWYAVCAPIHFAPVQFGALIEQLQRNAASALSINRAMFLKEGAWISLKAHIQQWIEEAKVDPTLVPILKGKLSSLNQAPQSVVFSRFLEKLGLEVSAAEVRAWKHRNMAAHGGVSDDPVDLILNGKLLRLLFHRMLAGITRCSLQYCDYYSLGHPNRPLVVGVPERPSIGE